MSIINYFNIEKNSGAFKNPAIEKALSDIVNILSEFNYDEQMEISYNLNKIIRKIPTTAIYLDDSSFIPFPENKYYLQHKRTQDVLFEKTTKKIFNASAYGLTIRREYNDDENKEIELRDNNIIDSIYSIELSEDSIETIKLYFSKGGIVTGDYIDKCYIKSNNLYSLPNPINIPVCVINSNKELLPYYVVDVREPKLKQLMEYYDCPIKHNDTHFNIRSYKKLNNN